MTGAGPDADALKHICAGVQCFLFFFCLQKYVRCPHWNSFPEPSALASRGFHERSGRLAQRNDRAEALKTHWDDNHRHSKVTPVWPRSASSSSPLPPSEERMAAFQGLQTGRSDAASSSAWDKVCSSPQSFRAHFKVPLQNNCGIIQFKIGCNSGFGLLLQWCSRWYSLSFRQ